QPYLLRAARYHGEQTELSCPVCRKERLTNVHYVYGDALRTASGQAKSVSELHRMGMDHREFKVYVVEVCRSCGWNHLVLSFVLGRDGLPGQDGPERREAAREGDRSCLFARAAPNAGARPRVIARGTPFSCRRPS